MALAFIHFKLMVFQFNAFALYTFFLSLFALYVGYPLIYFHLILSRNRPGFVYGLNRNQPKSNKTTKKISKITKNYKTNHQILLSSSLRPHVCYFFGFLFFISFFSYLNYSMCLFTIFSSFLLFL